jgi:hypothetical protein
MAESKAKDAGQAEVQKKVEQEQSQGYIGTKVDPTPNEEYSLESGPDSPPVSESGGRLHQHHHLAEEGK